MNLKLKLISLAIILANNVFGQNDVTHLTKIERNRNVNHIEHYFDASLAPFYHGVASGDPTENAVIIWTRVTTNALTVDVDWKVALDPNMTQIVTEGRVTTNQSKDYTVKVDVKELKPFQTYYYQFSALGSSSLIGKTRTTPSQNEMVDNLRFAIVSCSNYQAGYFNAYRQIANRNDIDAVIHLGDYIYEYESGGYGYSDDLGRGHLPSNEIITLDDYRVRYSFYRLDPMLREAHQQHPFINIWDDHEFANDANKFGAENHNPSTEGNWETRKTNAHKAYFEWMPIRANTIEEYRLYRNISYGKLMDLVMLDTRIEGRDTQVNSSKNLISAAATNEEFKTFVKEVIAKKNLKNKDDVNEILQVVLPMLIRVNGKSTEVNNGLTISEFNEVTELLATKIIRNDFSDEGTKNNERIESLLQKGTIEENLKYAQENKATYKSILGEEQFLWLTEQLKTSDAKWKVIGNQVMMMPWKGIPSDDAWDGYDEERNRLLNYIKDNDIDNIVVLTGDVHTTFIGEIRYDGKCEMCEFVVPSVTSANLDALGSIIAGVGEFYIKLLNRHIKDLDLNNHGYYILDVRENRIQGDWFDTNTIDTPVIGEEHSRSWYVNFNDCKVRKASSYSNALRSKDIEGNLVEKTKTTEVIDITDDFTIIGVYPNPLEEIGNIHYLVNKSKEIAINMYDLNGIKIKQLQKAYVEKGVYNLSFSIPSVKTGTYLITIETNKTKATRTIIVK